MEVLFLNLLICVQGRIWQQLAESYNRCADEIWVINVGDIKPVELPLTFALLLAYDVRASIG